jgi:hypothetical protein
MLKIETQLKEPNNQSSPPYVVYVSSPDQALANSFSFIKIDPKKHRGILNILLQKDINHYQIFSNLSFSKLANLDFSIGVISKLHTNVF